MSTLKATAVIKRLKELGSEEKAKNCAWFFKTGKGQYGYGDIFYGVTVPEQRIVAKEFRDLNLDEIQKLLDNKYHECRLTALIILANQAKKTKTEQDLKVIYAFYLKNSARINNWDLVDTSAHYIVGAYIYKYNKDRKVLYKLAKSKLLWERRIAIIATWYFIQQNDLDDTFELCIQLMQDEEDLMHKACGWMLREAGKKDVKQLSTFLNAYAHKMPRTMLRYAIEKYSDAQRKKFLKIKKV